MNLFNFHIPASWILFLIWLIYILFYSKNDKNKAYVIFMWFFGVWLLGILTWATYRLNYVYGGTNNVSKVTLYVCTKNDCEYTGVVTYRPFLSELSVLTTPLYPILNCPNNSCVQEHIFIKKDNIKSINALE